MWPNPPRFKLGKLSFLCINSNMAEIFPYVLPPSVPTLTGSAGQQRHRSAEANCSHWGGWEAVPRHSPPGTRQDPPATSDSEGRLGQPTGGRSRDLTPAGRPAWPVVSVQRQSRAAGEVAAGSGHVAGHWCRTEGHAAREEGSATELQGGCRVD